MKNGKVGVGITNTSVSLALFNLLSGINPIKELESQKGLNQF
jgi:hypothetical protein